MTMNEKRPLLLLLLLLLTAGCTSCGGGGASQPAIVSTPTFNKTRAFADLQAQCDYGARVPGSAAHDTCGAWLATQFPGADKVVQQTFNASTPMGGPYDFVNIIAVYNSAGTGTPIILASHWDSRPKADNDPDPAKRTQPVMGANDGASGVAILLEIARLLPTQACNRPVVLALLDAEDSGLGSSQMIYEGFCIGAVYMANNWPAGVPKPTQGVLLDMVGGDDVFNPACPAPPGGNNILDFRQEANSLTANPTLVSQIWTIASRLGHAAYVNQGGISVTDDHLAFIAAGVRMIDVIDFCPEWHTTYDTPANCSPDALFQTGDTLLQYIYGAY
jgi:glutaminyl-peptide cyclotransferase